MAVIQLRGLSPAGAENAIARVWYVLEQRDIESPRVETRPDRDGRVDVRCIFAAQHDADAVLAELEGAWSVVAQA